MKYSIYQAPFYSFFSRDFYRFIGRQGKGLGLLYLLVIVFVCYSLHIASAYFHFVVQIDSAEVTKTIGQMPDISIKGGRMSINRPDAYRIKIHDSLGNKDNVIVFDPTGKTGMSDEIGMLLLPEGFLFQGREDIIPWSLPTFGKDFDLPASKFREGLKSIAGFLVLFFMVCFPLVWLGHVFLALIYGIVGLVMDRSKLGYFAAVRLSSVAMTPTIVLTTLLNVLFLRPEIWELLTVPICLGYLFFAYKAQEDAQTEFEAAQM